MLESTNALIGALIAVMREIDRCDALITSQALSEEAEEELGEYLNQLQEALPDLREVYEVRLTEHPQLLPYLALRDYVKAQQFPQQGPNTTRPKIG